MNYFSVLLGKWTVSVPKAKWQNGNPLPGHEVIGNFTLLTHGCMDNRESQCNFSGPCFCILIFHFSALTTTRTQNSPLQCSLELQTSVPGNCPTYFTQQKGTPTLPITIVNWPTSKVSSPPYYQPYCYRLHKNY